MEDFIWVIGGLILVSVGRIKILRGLKRLYLVLVFIENKSYGSFLRIYGKFNIGKYISVVSFK